MSSTAIIGGADAPTSIFVAGIPLSGVLWTVLAAAAAMIAIAAFVILKHRKK